MIGAVVALGILLGVLLLPIGVRASYNADGAFLYLILGPIHGRLYPGRKTAQKAKTKQIKEQDSTKTSGGNTASGGSLNDFLPILKVVYELLRDFKRKLRVDRLEFKLVLAGDDPCDLSLNYGRTWAALGNLMPHLENFLTIRKRNLEIACDYFGEQTTVMLLVDLTITAGRLLCLAIRYGLRGLVEYRKLLNIRKGGA